MRKTTRLAAILVLMCAGLPLLAQPFPNKGGQPGRGIPMERGKQGYPERMQRMERMPDYREYREYRDYQGPGRPVQDRMSPEERRQLRRDIDQHGRELYRGRNR
jgi:hypothetical protein